MWRYQRGNQNHYIEEGQTTQWATEKVIKNKQRSTKHTHRTTDRVTRTPLKTAGEFRCSGMVGCFCSTSVLQYSQTHVPKLMELIALDKNELQFINDEY